MPLRILSYKYQPSTNRHFQGNKQELQKKIDEGYRVVRGGNGSYVIAKPSTATITTTIDGHHKTFDVKEIIRDVYNKDRVTEKSLITFADDVNNGKKELNYTEDGLTIK